MSDMTLYEFYQQIMGRITPLTDEQLQEKKEIFKEYKDNHINNYYMLLCRDISYYTIFNILSDPYGNEDKFEDVVIECAQDIGQIISIEENADTGSVEIWVKPEEKEPLVMYLFGYDKGVVICQ